MRISSALSRAIAEHPSDSRLQKQLIMLGNAKISTIDSFFTEPVRANFEKLGFTSIPRLVDSAELEETREHWRAIMISKHNLEMENLLNRKNVLSIKQNESKCVKESSIDPPKVDKFNNGGAAVYRRENVAPKDILLPPLIAPNDDRIKDMQMKEIEIQRNKNQQFRAYQKQKEIEDNRSDFSSRQNSARSGRSDLLPPPKLYIKKEKNSARTKKISPSGSGCGAPYARRTLTRS